jgi:hypothetical protein
MAIYHFDLKVVSCRGKSDKNATGSKTESVGTRAAWEYQYTSTNVASAALGNAEFIGAALGELDKAPGHISGIARSGGLWSALAASATTTNDGVATSGPWSERVGKDVFRYEIGVSTTSAAAAATARTAHNLS